MRYDSDIALVELDGEVKLTKNVYPICLPDMIRDFEVSGKVINIYLREYSFIHAWPSDIYNSFQLKDI